MTLQQEFTDDISNTRVVRQNQQPSIDHVYRSRLIPHPELCANVFLRTLGVLS